LARYDKYDPISGGFRAPLAADLTATEDTGVGNPIAVTLNTSGRVVAPAAGATASGIVGLVCTSKNMKAGDIVDVMTAGEIVEVQTFVAGEEVVATYATGALANGAAGNATPRVGFMVEAGRLVVRVAATTAAAT